MKILSRLKGWWTNRAALIEKARLRALHVGETALEIAGDSRDLTRRVLDAMLFVEQFYPQFVGSAKARKVLALLRDADDTIRNIEPYVQKAIDWMHSELNKDGKVGWEKP